MKPTESTFRPALMIMLGRAAAFAVTFFIPPILARIFTQAEFGTYKQFLLVTYTLFQFGQLGLAECLFYFLPANPHAGGRYAFNSFVMLGGVGLLFAIGLASASHRVAGWLSNAALSQYLLLAGLYLIFMLMGTVLEITMICRKRFRLATVIYVLSDILRVLFLLIPALITRSLEWTFIGGVAFCVMRFLGVLRYFRREFAGDLRFDAALLGEQLAYALPFTTAVAFQIIQSNYHQYAVSFYFD